jgi:hypothetical protein
MKTKTKGNNRSNPVPPISFYPHKSSLRGKMNDTKDEKAIVAFVLMALFFMLFFILGVINNNSKVEDESVNKQINQIKERIFKILQ